jgi:acetyltransferase-like isoleucine patch superfamily enzyme
MYAEPARPDAEAIARKVAAAPGIRMQPQFIYITNSEGRIIDVETEGVTFANKLRKWVGQWLFNMLVAYVPSHTIRQGFLRRFGAIIGKNSWIGRGTQVRDAHLLTIGNGTTIGCRCLLDCRSGIWIGDNVTIASDVHFIAGGHDINHPDFPIVGPDPTVIEDYVWIANRAMAMPCHIRRGAVVTPHALVIKDVGELDVVGGNPAKVIGKRSPDALHYSGKHRRLMFS